MLVLVLSGLAAARRVAQTRQTRLCKAAPPVADRRRARAHSLPPPPCCSAPRQWPGSLPPETPCPAQSLPRLANLLRSPAARPSISLPPLSSRQVIMFANLRN